MHYLIFSAVQIVDISKIAPHLSKFGATLETGRISPESHEAEKME